MANHDIMTIGASAGGIDALKTVVSSVSPDIDASFFVALHLTPEFPSALPSILQNAGKLLAVFPEDKAPIRRGVIYVAPPDRHLLVQRGVVRVVRGPKENRHRPAIDPLFRSAAWAYGPRVTAVVLSGYLDDGAAGGWAVKTCGGTVIVQDPIDAQVSDMPRNAIKLLEADYCLPASKIGPQLTELAQTPLPDGGAPPVPESIQRETGFALMEQEIGNMDGLGSVSAFTCPACHGALWELRDGKMIRYRCHTGHAYSLESLLAETDEVAENALYSAMRALEEKAMIAHRMGEDFERGSPEMAAVHYARANKMDEQVAVLRELITNQQKT